MKYLLLTTFVILVGTMVFAGQRDTIRQDTVKKKKKVTVVINSESIGLGKGDSTRHSKSPGVIYSITFTRFDLGFTKLVDNGSFTLSPQNQFLAYKPWKTSTVGFDVLQFGYRFNSSFKVYLAAGFDWTLIRLKNNITILPGQPVLSYREDAIEYSKNRFSASYLRLPLGFELRSKDDNRGKKFRLVIGPEGGFLLNGKVKQVSGEKGKQKVKDDYHFSSFRYGAYARIGYGGAGLFAKYYFNDMFENSPAQSGLRNMSFGIMFGF